MSISSLKFVNAVFIAFLLVSPFVVGLTASQYDPWADINDDGKIDIKDVAYTAKLFGTLGDPTKNVTVTNWPISTEVSVWWFQFMDVDETKASAFFNASGFGQLHVLAFASDLTASETITVTIRGIMHDSGHTTLAPIDVSTFALTSSSTMTAITIPVPNAEFQFYAETGLATIGYISLSFYLTWA
ncbi:MAG: hypothetical protein JSW72_07690 [Candidatus Bathyarchaeota archaeon]|nr:MAG: hypothetical protein JSW72_07690 [Candidatus Bathyarchaeota archaeon]